MIHLQPAKFGGNTSVKGLELPIEATAEFTIGAVLALNAGEVEEHAGATTVTGILGVSGHGTEGAGDSESPSGECVVFKAHGGQVYLGQMIDTAVVKTDLSGIVVGVEYGIIKVGGDWYVDFEDTTNVVLTIQKVDDNLDIVWFKFLDSAVVVI